MPRGVSASGRVRWLLPGWGVRRLRWRFMRRLPRAVHGRCFSWGA